jgi:membrane-bound lytic murein transglycosylase B
MLLVLLAGCQSSPSIQASDTDRQVDAGNPEVSSSGETRSDADMPSDFPTWLAGFRRDARAEGISESTLARALDGVRYRPRVIELDRSQPEFVRPIWEYFDTAVSATRVSNGRDHLATHRDTAQSMEQRFDVPGEVIVAIWGIESNYGGNFGDFSTLESLATLAYDGRRRDFARGELLAALRILDQGDIAP